MSYTKGCNHRAVRSQSFSKYYIRSDICKENIYEVGVAFIETLIFIYKKLVD